LLLLSYRVSDPLLHGVGTVVEMSDGMIDAIIAACEAAEADQVTILIEPGTSLPDSGSFESSSERIKHLFPLSKPR
jgi:hypothetical protein